MVNWADGFEALVQLTGSNVYNPQTGNLDRQPPLAHPLWPQLYCTRVHSMKPYRFVGKAPVMAGMPGSQYLAATPEHTYWLIGCTFTQPRYRVLGDSSLDLLYGQPRQEYQRYLSWNIEPASDVLTRDVNTFAYAEGPNQGKPFPGQVAQFLAKSEVIFRWWNVPRAGVFSSGGNGPPNNIINGLGRVNLNAFLGFPAGTLLLKGARFLEQEAPTTLAVNSGAVGTPPLSYTVELCCGYFSPPAYGSPPAHLGWNLVPQVGDPLWVYVTVDGNPASASVLPTYDYTLLFNLQS
jgi:hypothetical protein